MYQPTVRLTDLPSPTADATEAALDPAAAAPLVPTSVAPPPGSRSRRAPGLRRQLELRRPLGLRRIAVARARLARRLARRIRGAVVGPPDAGMTTAEYAIGTVAACAFAAILYRVVTSGTVSGALGELLDRALHAV